MANAQGDTFIKWKRRKWRIDVSNKLRMHMIRLYANDDNIDADIQNMFLHCLPKAITGEKSEALNKPFELHELKKAIGCMSKNKSPGIDGIPVEFYQQFYDVIVQDLLAVYHEIYKNNLMSESQRTAVLSLLPKKGDPLDPANRRPISLLTVDYKIISKVLQLRLSHVMPDIVDEHQTCSVPGRSIHSNLCLLRDIVDCSKIRNNCCALISMDQHKAFDKVNWVFLFKVLEKLNFGSYFTQWVRILYTDIKSRLFINNEFGEDVCIGRGVRQGCPLSPSLYVLFIEPLARYIRVHKGIQGFHVPGGGGRSVKFLQYADDATCVATSQTDVEHFFRSFSLFERATGASLNLKKTQGLKLGGFVGRKLKGNIDWREDQISITGFLLVRRIVLIITLRSCMKK